MLPWSKTLGLGTVAALAVWVLAACAGRAPAPAAPGLPLIGFSIQAGAFAVLENAVRLADVLQGQGQDATFFRDRDGLYKVRFGSFETLEAARLRAESLRHAGVLTAYALIRPEAIPAHGPGKALMRERIVRTAQSFLGMPYRWGGDSAATGFDCSGLTMAAYRLNGFALPRTSAEQFRSGKSVPRGALAKGDLVFFSFSGKGGGTHVGLFIGNRRFIHAPGVGSPIRVDDLSAPAYGGAFIGARSYL